MNILVRSPNWIGDQVLAYPFFHFLRELYPDAHIAAVCVPWVADLQFKNLVDEVLPMDRPPAGMIARFQNVHQFAKKLSDRQWDLGISLPNSFSAGWLLHQSGAKRRRGYSVDARSFLLNERMKWDSDSSRHRSQAFVDLLPEAKPIVPADGFWGTYSEDEFGAKTPGVLSEFDVEQAWPGDKIKAPQEPFWILGPGATADSRRWPVQSFLILARTIAEQTGMRGLIVGGYKEAPIAERLVQEKDCRLSDYTARGPVSSLANLFRRARFTVTNESGLAHVASLCGSPVQVVCGAADPRRTRPIGPGKVQVKVNPVECWPCERNTCAQPIEKNIQCLKGIHPEDVWKDIEIGLHPEEKTSGQT